MELNPGVRSQAATPLLKTFIGSLWPRNWGLEAFEPSKHGLVARVTHFRTISASAYKSLSLRRGLKGSTPRPGGLCLTAHTNSDVLTLSGTLELCLLCLQEMSRVLLAFPVFYIYIYLLCADVVRGHLAVVISQSSLWVPGILGLVESTSTYWAILLFLVCLTFIEKYNKEKNQDDVGQALQHNEVL